MTDDRSERLRKRRKRARRSDRSAGDADGTEEGPESGPGTAPRPGATGSAAPADSPGTSEPTERSKPSELSEPSEASGSSEPSEPGGTPGRADGSIGAGAAEDGGNRSPEDGDSDGGGAGSVKEEQVGTYMYLPKSQTKDLKRVYNVLKAEYEFEFDAEFEKNRHFYPLVVQYGLEGLEEMDAAEVRDRLEGMHG